MYFLLIEFSFFSFEVFSGHFQKLAFESDLGKRSGKILHINILPEWGMMGFLYSKVVGDRSFYEIIALLISKCV